MSFIIKFQRNNSEKNRLDKEIDTITQLTGVLKDETSVVDPVILIEGDLTEIINCNYMTVNSFKRSYFINNIRSIRNGLIEVSAHVDVLTSYADEIRSNTAIVRRQENNWNLYLNDGTFKVYQNPMVLTKAFPSGFTTQNFVLAVAGG